MVDASGSAGAVQAALQALAPGGRCVLVGLGEGPIPWPLESRQLLGAFAYATYDLTNQATLKVWSTQLTLLDMAWGALLTGLAASAGAAAAPAAQTDVVTALLL